MAPSSPYPGPLRRLVLAFDVGTTFSGIAYTFLDPGEVPNIYAVTRYPGQENSGFKIPSILYYTPNGKVHAAGAEAALPSMRLEAEDEDLFFVEWFKLHLRPTSMITGMQREALPELPPGKTVIDVFGDFLKYLFSCARRFITQTHANGESLWGSVDSRIDFIFGHPNGWEGLQQSKMRQAAVAAELIPDTPAGHARVHFVTEGEASLHYCLDGGLASDVIKAGSKVVIIDAGGGTVDLSSYSFVTTSPITVEEIATPDCILQGSTRVNVRAKEYFKEKLRESPFGNDEDIRAMVEHFEQSTKPIFKDPQERSYVKFGSMRDKDPSVGIRGGQLQLSGKEVESLFEPSVVSIMEAVRRQCEFLTGDNPPAAFLVGGFGASPWLFARLEAALRTQQIRLCRPDHHTNKAVAEGAASYYIQQFVASRIAKYTYGTEVIVDYNEENPEHHLRRGRVRTRPSGRKFVPEGFQVVLSKGSRMRENEKATISLYVESPDTQRLDRIICDVICYRGKLRDPRWVDLEPEMFASLCTVYANTSAVTKVKQYGINGSAFYTQNFKLVLLCGLTETKAQLSWIENGEEKESPAEIVYDDDALTA